MSFSSTLIDTRLSFSQTRWISRRRSDRMSVVAVAATGKDAKGSKLTHFLSLPLVGLVKEVESLQGMIAERFSSSRGGGGGGDKGRTIRIKECFISPQKLHLTLGMLSLRDDAEVALAARVMQNAIVGTNVSDRENLLGPFEVRFNGFGTFGSVNKARVCYLNPTEETRERLKRITSAVLPELRAHNLLSESEYAFHFTGGGQVKTAYHATLINVKYLRSKGKNRNPTVDCTQVIEAFGETVSRYSTEINNIELSSLSGSLSEQGYYCCEHHVALDSLDPVVNESGGVFARLASAEEANMQGDRAESKP